MGTGIRTRAFGACLVCGEPLIYRNEAQEMTCSFCGKSFPSHASCRQGHFICDSCHAEKGLNAIMEECRQSRETDPFKLAEHMMENPYIYMHGPEHHVLVGAALITAFHHAGGKIDLGEALEEMLRRGKAYPGGSCGFWGCCGAAVSTGMFMSVILKATPLTTQSWALSNEITARTLQHIAELGGPRCCKRNSFAAIQTACAFVKERLGIDMRIEGPIVCRFYEENRECKKKACPYHPVNHEDFTDV